MSGREPAVSSHANQYIRAVLHPTEAPTEISVRYFYTSPLAIDDPLSPIPPPVTGAAAAAKKQLPRPFSLYDNNAVNTAWLGLRKKILQHNEELGEKKDGLELGTPANPAVARLKRRRAGSAPREGKSPTGRDIPLGRSNSSGQYSRSAELFSGARASSSGSSQGATLGQSMKALDPSSASPTSGSTTTGTPFIRAPSRTNVAKAWKPASMEGGSRPTIHEVDSYRWDDEMEPAPSSGKDKGPARSPSKPRAGPSVQVPVGVSRLHHVAMDAESIRMEPIYWSPLSDISRIIRGTWFYKDSMMPVEVEVANMLEAGYIELQPWTQTWKDELSSAVEVGALGEMKVLHKLWPDKPSAPDSRPSTSQQMQTTGLVQSTLPGEQSSPEQERLDIVENACDRIDISNGPNGPDNKAAGDLEYGAAGYKQLYLKAGVIYASDKDAYILKPALQPSDYYGRRPLANYIRKGRTIGVCVVRGFDQTIWDKLHPSKLDSTSQKAYQGASTAQAGAPAYQRLKSDPELAMSERPRVTDLVLVIHGIGQKLSERMETFHFTHAMNSFRREVNVELGTPDVKRHLRRDMGGVMLLPINWRQRVSLETGADTEVEHPTANKYTLKDITPVTLPSIRNIISDVMLDVPYYLSPQHNPTMIAACIQEANRVYRLWCANNPGFAEYGRVHLVAHSLGSVMAIDILSNQPTRVDPGLTNPTTPDNALPRDHFIFNTTDLFVCGSPAALFLLMKDATLLPRRDTVKPGADSYTMPDVAGEQGTYGCIAVDNIYNIINPYDPVAMRINATVDASYAEMLKPATIPSSSSSYFSFVNPFRRADSSAQLQKPSTVRLPSNVELETHNFTREEVAEKRAYLLNDNGQIDYFMKYGGGALEIQYLTMLGAHSSYWLSRDFVRMIVLEVGREAGREGTIERMRAVKKKMTVGGG
ncbi:uncharacterized protein M421DRAFT_418156 [Didymella exigua CBS 183.55]|uniref:DDHD domain-containing protein n=1 Tax=Didymella exigua CBS 183.55 TaxID=1150837 RepID=A0A6A5RUL1_9PLEO|nr:uncharacterized protein M421DRAFT_418156 [Didymella exigua CBS 183.55]KAF1930678.1 hypothetical protein M421DRAFT_418156 [Didymella exigua CBS 183.55]